MKKGVVCQHFRLEFSFGMLHCGKYSRITLSGRSRRWDREEWMRSLEKEDG